MHSLNNFDEIKVEQMSLYIEEQDQQLNEVAGTWGSASTFTSASTMTSSVSTASSAATSSSFG
ncbi:thiocillin family RiPP [Viridibacillus sp. NPDC093762]|uniref:thiocillin family RiPP n=1 Tax=Viridibacillus sp. NPDC093762 TaxID=3390720 RepID=UPI003D06567C